MQKINAYFDEAVRSLQIADHMIYVSYPLLNERKLLLKVLDELYKAVILSANAILYDDSKKNKQININENPEFFNKFLKNSMDKNQIEKLIEILRIHNKHKSSAMEFFKNNKLVIMSDDLMINTLDILKIKEYLLVSKQLIQLVHKKIKDSS
jgi:hypothetical protein